MNGGLLIVISSFVWCTVLALSEIFKFKRDSSECKTNEYLTMNKDLCLWVLLFV